MNDTSQPAPPQGLEEAPASFASAAKPRPALRADELRGRNLRTEDLSRYEGLLPEHLAGSDLTGNQTVPPEIAKFPALEQVKAISAEARKVFIALLAACVYSWLVIGTTKDVALILNTASSPLPVINTPIPIAGFYVVAAAILAAVYCYLHFYLQRLWRTLATLPAVFPDAVALDDKTDPWLLTNLVRTEFTLLRPTAPPLARLENILAVFLTWWLVPLTLLALWGRYLPAHGWLGTSWLVFLIGLATLFGRHTYRLARAALQGQTSLTAEPTDADGGILARAWRELRGLRPDKLTGSLTVGLVVCSISAFRDNPRDPYTWVAKGLNAFDFIGIRTYADLREVEVAQKPEAWDGNDLSKVKRVDLRGRNLAFADAEKAFLANADLRDADLAGADLREAQLQGADFSGARLQGADLNEAVLQRANLFGAQLQGADLTYAQLQGADLFDAHLQGADFTYAELQGADFTYAQLQGAVLGGADLYGADLRYAQLQGADLIAQLQGADLRYAQLQGADLRGADLRGADLSNASLSLAQVSDFPRDWDYANLRGSGVTPMNKVTANKVIAASTDEITDESIREQLAGKLMWALETNDRPSLPEFPAEWRSHPNVMFDAGDPEPEPFPWGTPRWASELDYYEDLGEFLGGLACGRSVPDERTRGLARRALRVKHESPLKSVRLWPRLFVARVLGPDCPPAKGLPDDLRRDLEQLAATFGPS